jgi:beta-xylosidase
MRCLSVILALLVSDLRAANPILSVADPHAVVFDKTLWIYPTGGGGGTEFFAWSSTDGSQWKKHGPILRLDEVRWIRDDGAERHFAWAPCAIRKDRRYYFYYSVGPQNPTPSRIGVAVGDRPEGPFRDSGKPLLTGGSGFEAIDPFVFQDPETGTCYLYAGGSAGSKLRVFELSPDMVSFKREIPVKTPRLFTEGPFVHHHAGRYYLSYSHGNYRDASYSVHYATGETAIGPWTYQGVILASDHRHKGPGHHSMVRLPGSEPWFIVYHRWNDREGGGPFTGKRETCIDRLEHTPDGKIARVVMTDAGVDLMQGGSRR